MRHTSRRLLALAVACLLAGCSASSNSGSVTTPTTSLTGNWYFSTLYPGPAPANIVYSGALSQSGANVTAILHNSCFSTQDIDFAGTEDASGNLTLTSNNLASNVVTIKGMVMVTGGVIQSSNYAFTVTGAAPCAPLSASLTGSLIPTFSGNFAGSLNSTVGATANFTVALAQGTANSDGQFPLSGTVTVSSSACTVSFPLNIFFSGAGFTANLASSTGPTSTAIFSATAVASGTPSFLTNVNIAVTGCNAGTFTGILNKQ